MKKNFNGKPQKSCYPKIDKTNKKKRGLEVITSIFFLLILKKENLMEII